MLLAVYRCRGRNAILVGILDKMLTEKTADQSSELNICYIKTYSANMFPFPLLHSNFFRKILKPQASVILFFKIEVSFVEFFHFCQPFVMRYFKMCIKNEKHSYLVNVGAQIKTKFFCV